MRVLGIIPARGGSKGVPRKNIRLLGNKPLLQYTIESAGKSKKLTRFILSTEDDEIAEVGRSCGAEIPFKRPAALAQDDTPMILVLQHALQKMEERGDHYDAVCLLQPSSPFRTPHLIDTCIRLFFDKRADTIMTVLPVPHKFNPHWVYLQDKASNLYLSTGEKEPISRRQDLPDAYFREGSVYIARRDLVMEENTLYGQHVVGYPIDPSATVVIDSPDDWKRAECIICGESNSC